jgi:hypothetical protein
MTSRLEERIDALIAKALYQPPECQVTWAKLTLKELTKFMVKDQYVNFLKVKLPLTGAGIAEAVLHALFQVEVWGKNGFHGRIIGGYYIDDLRGKAHVSKGEGWTEYFFDHKSPSLSTPGDDR